MNAIAWLNFLSINIYYVIPQVQSIFFRLLFFLILFSTIRKVRQLKVCKLFLLILRPPQTRKHCCGNIVADANVSLFARARNIYCGRKICVRDAKNVSEFFQIHFASATNAREMFLGLRGKEAKHLFCLPLVCSPWKHCEQHCFRNNVSSFARAFI